MTARLDADDVELIARRVLALVRTELESEHGRLIDARALAQLLGVTRGWVYAHAEELQAVRLGGPRGRLRFDLARVIERENGASAPRPRRRTPAAKVMRRGANLLPIDP